MSLAHHRDMLEAALKKLLAENASIKLGSVSEEGAPWLATAYFAAADPFKLTVLIESTGRTLANLRANPRVAVMIEHGDAMALFAQAEGVARLVDERHAAIRDAIAEKTPAAAPLVALPNLVGVELDISRWRLTDVPAGWLPGRELSRP